MKMRWQDKLDREELQHVRGYMGRSLKGVKRCRAAQVEMVERDRAAGRIRFEPCFLCKQIARKLGLEGGQNA
jgi:hypothetical protein